MSTTISPFAPWLALAGIVAGCSSPYPDVGTGTTRRTTPTAGSTTSAEPADAGSSYSPPSTTWGDAGHPGTGTGTGTGAGTSDAGQGGGASAFLGETAAYASAPVATTAREHHQALGQIQQQPTTECLGCHSPAGVGSAFLAAGFVATQPNGQNGAADIEVRVWSSAQSAGASAHTDADGFFWIPANGTVTAPFKAGARDATHAMVMPTAPPGGGCDGSSCHGGSQGAVHVP